MFFEPYPKGTYRYVSSNFYAVPKNVCICESKYNYLRYKY